MNNHQVLPIAASCIWFAAVAIAEIPSYESDVKSILQKRCVDCHGGDTRKNGLDLRTRNGLISGGKTGSAMQPGSLRESLLWTFIATDKMPADDGKLTSDEKDVLRRWILAGAPETDKQAAKIAEREKARTVRALGQVIGVKKMAAQIDRRILEPLERLGVVPSELANDAEFLRRVFLDLAGRVPSFDETVSFLDDDDDQKRSKLVEALLGSPEFGQNLGIIWHKLLIPKSAGAYTRIPHKKFREWLASQFNSNQGWDEIVTDMITAEGYLPSNKDNDIARKKDIKLQPQNVATAFINVHNTEGRPQPKGIVASVSRLFLAQSIECAQCHNHPLAKWEQTDFWAAAAFFERVRYERAVYGDTSINKLVEPIEGKDLIYDDKAKARYSFVPGVYPKAVIDLEDANGGRTGRMIRAKFLDGIEPQLEKDSSYRIAFADWTTSRENPFFASALVNRVWAQLLGRGFVEPVDDMSEDNRPSHPELLEELSCEFAASGFDVKHLMRCICNSQTYQRSSVPAKSSPKHKQEASGAAVADSTSLPPDALFAKQSLKQLTEDQLLASLEITLPTFAKMLEEDAKDKNPGLGKRDFLEVHETGIGPATEHTRGLQQALRMMNGDGKLFNREALNSRVSDKNTVEENIKLVYLQALNRRPSVEELDQMKQYVSAATDEIDMIDKKRLPTRRKDQPDNTPDPYADVLWALINSGEFIFNH